jgi:hypothetical protein
MSNAEMTTGVRKESPVRQARIAGALWLLCIVAGLVGFMFASPLIVANDAAATAANIVTKESSYRLGFAFDLISGASYLGTTVFIYWVLKPVSRSLSMLAAFFGLAGVAIGGVAWVSRLGLLVLLHGDQYLSAFPANQLQAMAMTALKLQLQVFSIGMVFFGVQCMSIGYLVARSIFLPRVLGILLGIGGTSYVIASFASFLIPSFGAYLVRFVVPVALIGEGSLTVWLLVKGVNERRWYDQAGGQRRISTDYTDYAD